MFSATGKAKLFAKNFSKSSNCDNSSIPPLPAFSPGTNLKLYNIFISPKMVKKVDSPKASGPNYNSSVGSKELWVWTFIHTSWNLQYVSERVMFSRLLESLFMNVEERSTAKIYHPVTLLSVVTNLVNDRIIDYIEKCGFFSDFLYGFRSSDSCVL